MTAINQNSRPEVQSAMQRWQPSGLAELGLALSTRWSVLDRVVRRVNLGVDALAREIPEGDRLNEHLQGGFVVSPADDNLVLDLCADVDAFLFESRSLYEVTGKFITLFTKEVLGRETTQADLLQVLKAGKVDTAWVEDLRVHRILFFHQTAPWLGLEVLSVGPPRFDLVLLKENVRDLSDPDRFLRFEAVRAMWRGFERSMDVLFDWLVKQLG